MRLYIPLVPDDLTTDISPRWAHAVTDALRSAQPHEDREGWEMITTLAAADDSMRLLDTAPYRRLVGVAEVPDNVVGSGEPEGLPTLVHLIQPVAWDRIESILVDEPGYEETVRQAMDGSEEAFDRCGDIELLWYDVLERSQLAHELQVS